MKYNLTAQVTVSIYTEVEAESLEEAIEIAQQRDIETYKYGDKGQSKYVWVSESFDGEPQKIKESD